MSQTLLYRALGIRGVSYRSTQVLGNAMSSQLKRPIAILSVNPAAIGIASLKGRPFDGSAWRRSATSRLCCT